MTARRSIGWPDRETAAVYFGYGLMVDAVFLTVYCGANWLAAMGEANHRLYMDWELSIPFMPGFVWVYCSLWVLFFVPLFQLDPAALRRLAFQVMGATLAAGVVFVLLPADIGFARPADFSGSAALDHLIFRYNSAPSLHVIFAGLIVLALCEVATPLLCTVYRVWLVLIAVATVLTHQHHIIDVLSAAIFIAGARWLVPTRATSAAAPVESSAMEETGVNQTR